MSEQREPSMTIIYRVTARKVGGRHRVVVEMGRDQAYIKKVQLGRYEGKGLVFPSKQPRYFLDVEDELNVLKECQELIRAKTGVRDIGSIEIRCFLFAGPRIEVRFITGELLAQWTPTTGLHFEKDAHPVFRKDLVFIALTCSELPQGGSGGIFANVEEQTERKGIK